MSMAPVPISVLRLDRYEPIFNWMCADLIRLGCVQLIIIRAYSHRPRARFSLTLTLRRRSYRTSHTRQRYALFDAGRYAEEIVDTASRIAVDHQEARLVARLQTRDPTRREDHLRCDHGPHI